MAVGRICLGKWGKGGWVGAEGLWGLGGGCAEGDRAVLAGRRSGKELRDHPELPPARPRTLPAVPTGQAAALAVVAALWGGSGGHGAAAGPRPPPAAPGRAALPQPQPQGESNNKLEMCWLLRVVINHKDFGVAQFIMAFKLLLDVVYISVYAPYRLYINRIYNILTVSIYKQYCDKCIVGLSIVFK